MDDDARKHSAGDRYVVAVLVLLVVERGLREDAVRYVHHHSDSVFQVISDGAEHLGQQALPCLLVVQVISVFEVLHLHADVKADGQGSVRIGVQISAEAGGLTQQYILVQQVQHLLRCCKKNSNAPALSTELSRSNKRTSPCI